MILSVFLIVMSYFVGSICSAVIVCRLFNLPDPRTEGSRNPGATNVLRLAGKKYASIVFFIDFLKGTIPVVIAQFFNVTPLVLSLVMLSAVLGHIYPAFFNFKGGKGVATAIGALVGLNLIVGTLAIATWLLVAHFFRYSSLASMITVVLAPFYALFITHQQNIFPFLMFMAFVIIFKHRNNITRLMDGNEPKVFIKENLIKDVIEDTEPLAPTSEKSNQKEND